MHILRHFGATLPVSCSSLSVSLVFHKSFLLYQFSLQFLLVLYQVNSAQTIIHLQLTANNCSSIHYEISCSGTAEILSNNFPCISTFLCGAMLKIIAMTYKRVFPNTIELGTLRVSFSSVSVSFSH